MQAKLLNAMRAHIECQAGRPIRVDEEKNGKGKYVKPREREVQY